MTAEHDASSTRPQVTTASEGEEDERFFSLLSDAERERIWERMMRRPERKPAEPGPLSDFDRTFQELVGPKLEGFIRLGATLVAQGLESFSEAHDRVLRAARQRGAGHLSDPAWRALEEWTGTALLGELR